jgi:hypothetical protein
MNDRHKMAVQFQICCVMPHIIVPVTELMVNSSIIWRPGVVKISQENDLLWKRSNLARN